MIKPQSAAQPSSPPRQLVCCAVQEEEFCFDLSDVRSISRAHQIAPYADQELPVTSPLPLGWVAAQQMKLPVYDLAHRLNLASQPDAQNAREGFVLVLNARQPFAVRVDRITGRIDVPQAQLTPLPPIVSTGATPLFKGIAQVEEKWLLCADANQLASQEPNASNKQFRSVSEVTALPSTSSQRRVEENVAPVSQKNPAQILLFSAASPVEETSEDVPVTFGLSVMQVQSVSACPQIMPIPHAPPYVFGITKWRNEPVPVVDLKACLGITATPAKHTMLNPKSRLLIAQSPGTAGFVGFLVNSQIKTLRLPISCQANQQPLNCEPELIKGIFAWEGLPLVIPDLDAALSQNFVPRQK